MNLSIDGGSSFSPWFLIERSQNFIILHNAMPNSMHNEDRIKTKRFKPFQRSFSENGSSPVQRLRDRGRRWCSLRDLRPGAGGVRPGDRHRDSRVLPLDMCYSCGLENSVRCNFINQEQHSQVVGVGIKFFASLSSIYYLSSTNPTVSSRLVMSWKDMGRISA